MGAVSCGGKKGGNEAESPTVVTLHIYDLGVTGEAQLLNAALQPFGTGAFHCGVEIYGTEWSYRGKYTKGTGIFSNLPRSCQDHTYREPVAMGSCRMSRLQVMQLLEVLGEEWVGTDYDTLTHNCCHFCDRMCRCLGVGGIPEWVLSLASAGAALYETGNTLDKSRRAMVDQAERELRDCVAVAPPCLAATMPLAVDLLCGPQPVPGPIVIEYLETTDDSEASKKVQPSRSASTRKAVKRI